MSVFTILRKIRATSMLLNAAREVDSAHPVLKRRFHFEDLSSTEAIIRHRREIASTCRCEACHAYNKAVARYDDLYRQRNPDLVTELPNPSKNNREES